MAIKETAEMADWLKVPSEVAISQGHPEWTPQDVMNYLERVGATNTVLYRRLQENPNFEEEMKARRNG